MHARTTDSFKMTMAITGFSFRQRIALLLALSIVVITVVAAVGPIPQDPGYHLFADSRAFSGIANFNDVMSNLGFALAGIIGLLALAGPKRHAIFAEPVDARPYLVFFLGIALLSLGSAYYHLAPSNDRLFWDRLPMSVAFMAISAAVVADRIDTRAGNGWLMLLLVAMGIASLLYWDWTETLGRGDLRPYAMVQFYPMLALPLVVTLFPNSRYTAGGYLVWVIFWYGLAKVLEHFDGQIFELLGHTVSGHTLKHLAAAVAPLVVLRMLLSKRRRIARSPAEH
jgi:hypothetical protein